MRSFLFFYLIVLAILLCFFSSISRAVDNVTSSSSVSSVQVVVYPAKSKTVNKYFFGQPDWGVPQIYTDASVCPAIISAYGYSEFSVDGFSFTPPNSYGSCSFTTPGTSSRPINFYVKTVSSVEYSCPPDDHPDFTSQSDSDGTPNPLGQFCANAVNPCEDFKGGSVDVYVNQHSVSTQVCFQGCKASVPIAVSLGDPDAPPDFKIQSYNLTGDSCSGADSGYIDPLSAQASNDALEQANKAAKSKADAADSASAAKTYDNQASAGLDTASAAERSAEAAAEVAKLKADADARVASQAPTDQQAQAQAQAAKSAQDAAQAAADAQAALAKAQTASQAKTVTSQSARDAQTAADAAQAAADRAAVAARDARQRAVTSGTAYDAAIASLASSAAGDAQAAADAAGLAAFAARNGQTALTGMGGGSGGSGSGGSGSGTGSGTGESEDPEGADFCKSNPGSIACIELGTAPDADNSLTDVINVSVTPASGWGSDNAECPQPVVIQGPAWAGDFTLDTEPLCRFLHMIRPVVIALAWLSAALIVMGFRRSGSDE
jgi:hypothetical protein